MKLYGNGEDVCEPQVRRNDSKQLWTHNLNALVIHDYFKKLTSKRVSIQKQGATIQSCKCWKEQNYFTHKFRRETTDQIKNENFKQEIAYNMTVRYTCDG